MKHIVRREAERARKLEEVQHKARELGKQKDTMVQEVLDKHISKLPPNIVQEFLT